MTVTKQQQLEWLAENCHNFNDHQLLMSINRLGQDAFDTDYQDFHLVTKKEWQRERDKMQKQPAQQAQDNSWHERGELPPVGCECEILGAFGHYQEWFPCKIIAEHSGSVFAANELAWINAKHGERKFRPLRTERENAIDDISSYFCDADGFQVTPHATDLIAARIYDAGYRKAKS